MIFPRFLMQNFSDSISPLSSYALIFLTFLLHFWKKSLILIMLLIFIFLFVCRALAFAAIGGPGVCGTLCIAQRNSITQYWGTPYGPWAPIYPYPKLGFHTAYGPVPYYYSWPPSPYRPAYLNDCPYCGPRIINNGINPNFFNMNQRPY